MANEGRSERQNMWMESAAAGSWEVERGGEAESCSWRANEQWPMEVPYPFQLVCERLRGFDKFPFLILVAVFKLQELRLQLSL